MKPKEPSDAPLEEDAQFRQAWTKTEGGGNNARLDAQSSDYVILDSLQVILNQ